MNIPTAWNAYRGYAAQSRTMQTQLTRFNLAALGCAVLAAICAAVAARDFQAQWMTALAGIAAGCIPIFGREILSTSVERKWLAARGVAEAIKSECFRFAGKVGTYAGAPEAADAAFQGQIVGAIRTASEDGIVGPLDDDVEEATYESVSSVDKRCPPKAMDAAWYLESRLGDQRRYFADRQRSHDRVLSRLRWLSLAASISALVAGVVGAATHQTAALAALIGAFVTAATAIIAYGLLDRRAFLSANYGAAALELKLIAGQRDWLQGDLASLVEQTEAVLASEHGIWARKMAASGTTDSSGGVDPAKADPPAR